MSSVAGFSRPFSKAKWKLFFATALTPRTRPRTAGCAFDCISATCPSWPICRGNTSTFRNAGSSSRSRARRPIVRYFDLSETVKPLAVKPPLRVLVMLSNPSDVDCLDVEKEWQKLKTAVQELEANKRLILERLERATLTDLLHRLRKTEYHVFHFVGHGSFDASSQEGVLAVEDENGRKQLISGSDFCNFLGDERAFRLVLLNACEGARASRTDPFSGVAQSLVLRGIPAVIAMQFEVSDEAAVAMASGFYSALADDYPVDAALSEARKAVLAAGCSVEWGTPVLYLRSPDGRIFDVDTAAVPPVAVRPVVPEKNRFRRRR